MGMVIETIVVEGDGHEVCFNATAIYHLEEITNDRVTVLTQRVIRGLAGYRDLTHLLWAGLEGARAWRKQLRGPWTIPEVLALIDQAGGHERFFAAHGPNLAPLVKAFHAAFPVTKELIAQKKAALEAAAQAPADTPRPTEPTGDSIGTSSSNPPAATGSTKRRSGGSHSVN